MANETTKVKTQIGWRDLGDNLIADLPGNETITFDMTALHESWKDFMLRYGVRQFVSSALAKMSYSMDANLKVAIIEAQVMAGSASAPEKLEGEKVLAELRETARAAKAAWLKENAGEIKSFLWKEFQALKVQKTVRESAGKETKAQVEARVKNELKAKAIAAGMAPEMADVVFA